MTSAQIIPVPCISEDKAECNFCVRTVWFGQAAAFVTEVCPFNKIHEDRRPCIFGLCQKALHLCCLKVIKSTEQRLLFDKLILALLLKKLPTPVNLECSLP
jgi:hypothetical protein